MSSQTSAIPLSESRNTRSQLYWNTLVRVPAQVINFAISLLVARMLMPRDFGIMGITMMLIGYANLFTNFGFAEAIIQKNIRDRKTLNSIFTFNLFVSSLLAICFFLAAGIIADFFHTPECKEVIRVMSIVFIVTSLPIVPGAVLRRDMDFKAVSIFDLIQAVLMSVATLLLAYKGLGYWALVYGQLVPLAVVSVLLCVKVGYFPFIYYNHSLMGDIYNFGGWNFFRVQLLFLSQHVDRFIIGKWMGPTPLGYYDKAMSLGQTPNQYITMNINSVMFSSFSLDKGYISRLQNSFLRSITLISCIMFPIYFGLIVIAPYFVDSILGLKWSPMIMPFQIIMAGLVIKSLGGITASLNVGIGKYREHTVRFLWSFILFLILCVLFLRKGIVGISIGYFIYSVIEVYLLLNLSLTNIHVSWLKLISAAKPALLATAIMFVITWGSSSIFFREHSMINMVFIIIIGSLTYAVPLIFDRSETTMDFKNQVKSDLFVKLMKLKR